MKKIHRMKNRVTSIQCHRWLLTTACGLVFGLLANAPMQAQQYLATLTGQVADSSGAVIPKANGTATNATTKFGTKVVTNFRASCPSNINGGTV